MRKHLPWPCFESVTLQKEMTVKFIIYHDSFKEQAKVYKLSDNLYPLVP